MLMNSIDRLSSEVISSITTDKSRSFISIDKAGGGAQIGQT